MFGAWYFSAWYFRGGFFGPTLPAVGAVLKDAWRRVALKINQMGL